ncbi:MAG: class I SAM-dependent methyltransferase [Acidobacteriota bacterium]
MASVQEHYDRHLGPVYGWMMGDFDVAKETARSELRDVGLFDCGGGVAIDLGSGPGAHAVALAEAGYAVTAIDTCAALLAGLRAHSGNVITCIDDDLLNLRGHCDGAAAVIVCMGDTLTHIDSLQSVERLFTAISETLRPGGTFVATFRDYATRTPEHAARFIPVRQDDSRILTCFLEYEETHVTVYDILHERTATGWALRVSSYLKLRLSPDWARARLNRLGLVTTIEGGRSGMVRLVARSG